MGFCKRERSPCDVRLGSKADKPPPIKIDLCLLWSKSGQTRAHLDCPLCADFVAKVGDAKSAAIASMY
jgi:hypothetical protein